MAAPATGGAHSEMLSEFLAHHPLPWIELEDRVSGLSSGPTKRAPSQPISSMAKMDDASPACCAVSSR